LRFAVSRATGLIRAIAAEDEQMINPRELIDIESYPIDDAASPIQKALVDRCRQDLDDQAVCALEGFVRPECVVRMAEEATKLAESAYKKENMRTAYGWMYNRDFPKGHPRAEMFLNSSSVVLTHQFPGNTLIEEIYSWDALTEFVGEVLGWKTLFRCACPHLSLMLSSMEKGGQNGWHFDTNDGVVSLLLQAPDQGGEFECAPYIRSEADENYETVSKLFSGGQGITVKPEITPGTFVLFKGRRTCHRVTEVGETTKPRLIALFSYNEKPGMIFPKTIVNDFMNPNPTPYYGKAAP
jgi:hypothetical protein